MSLTGTRAEPLKITFHLLVYTRQGHTDYYPYTRFESAYGHMKALLKESVTGELYVRDLSPGMRDKLKDIAEYLENDDVHKAAIHWRRYWNDECWIHIVEKELVIE